MSRFDVDGYVPILADIDDLDSVYRLIMNLRDQERKQTSGEEKYLSFPEQ